MNRIEKLNFQELSNRFRRVLCPGLSTYILAIALIPNVHAKPLYDFTQMLSEPHPFSAAALEIRPASSQTILEVQSALATNAQVTAQEKAIKATWFFMTRSLRAPV